MGFPFLHLKVASTTLTSRHNSTPQEPDARNTRAFGHYRSRALTATRACLCSDSVFSSLVLDGEVYVELEQRGGQ